MCGPAVTRLTSERCASQRSVQRQPVGVEIEAGTLDLDQSGALEVAEGGSDRFAAGSHQLGEVTVREAKLEADPAASIASFAATAPILGEQDEEGVRHPASQSRTVHRTDSSVSVSRTAPAPNILQHLGRLLWLPKLAMALMAFPV